MEPSEMSDAALLYFYSETLSKIDSLYKEKKRLESEIASRNSTLKQRYQSGKIKLEKED